MDGGRRIAAIVLSVWCLGSIGCHSGNMPEPSVPVAETLGGIARRISDPLSLRSLNHIATHGDALLGVLTATERDHLGRDYLQVTLKVPMVVYLAAPTDSVPFWVVDQGFESTELKIRNPD